MTVKRLAFNPRSDGFAFGNSWRLDAREQAIMPGIVIEIFERAEPDVRTFLDLMARTAGVGTAAVGAFARLALGRVGDAVLAAGATTGNPLVAAAGIFAKGLGAVLGTVLGAVGIGVAVDPKTAVKAALDLLIKEKTGAGFCGGMAATALDYHAHALVLPRGWSRQPQASGDAAEAWLRTYIFDRLCDTLRQYGPRFLTMQVIYHLPDGEDPGPLMLSVSRAAANQIIADIDAGQPCGVGLVTTALDPSESHQVICYGYEWRGPDQLELLIHDNKLPDQEGVLVVLFGETGVSFIQPDIFLSTEEQTHRISRKGTKVNPSWCSILYLDYTPHAPRPALAADAPLLAEPEAVIAGDPIAFSATLRAVGHGALPEGRVRLRRWNEPVEGRIATHGALNEGDTAGIRLDDRPPAPASPHSSIRYGLAYSAAVARPRPSVVHVLRARGLDGLLPQLAMPFMMPMVLPALNAGGLAMPSAEDDPMPPPYVKRVTTAAGRPTDTFVEVGAPRLVLESPDIGDRCDPVAYPEKEIRVVPGEYSLLPVEPALEWVWTISTEGAAETRRTASGELKLRLPKTVGAIVVVGVTVRYRGRPDLSATFTTTVNDEAGNLLAAQMCHAEQLVKELKDKARLPPAGKDPGWVMDRGLADRVGRPMEMRAMADMLAARVRRDAVLQREIARKKPR